MATGRWRRGGENAAKAVREDERRRKNKVSGLGSYLTGHSAKMIEFVRVMFPGEPPPRAGR